MDPLSTLNINVHHLTVEHQRLHVHEQRVEGGTVPGLIQQLRESIAVSGDRGGSGGQPVPLNMPAYSLLERINTQLRDELNAWHVHPTKCIEGAVRTWAKLARTDQDQTASAAAITTRWITGIKALFEPTRVTEIKGNCPSCGWAKRTVDVEGEERITSTLEAVGDTVTCGYCQATWTGEQLHYLKAALDTPALAVAGGIPYGIE